MANSYLLFTGNGSTTQYSLSGIDGWVNSGFLKVYLNDVLQTTGYSLVDMTTAPKVQFATAPALNVIVKIQRETPTTISGFRSNIVDFNDGSVLTASDLDKAVEGLVHIAQESNDTGSGAIGLNTAQTAWDGEAKRLTNLADGTNAQDAVTVAQLTSAALYGGATVVPQVWAFTGTGAATYALSPAPLNTTEEMFLVEVGGVIQHPDTYTINAADITFDAVVGSGIGINIRNLGVARNLNESVTTAMLADDAVTSAKIATGAVDAAELASNAVTTAKIANDAVTYAKIQNVSATDKVLGRSTAGAGDVEEITCTAAGRALLDDATAADQRATLGLTSFATKTSVVNADVDANALIDLSKLATLAANTLVGRGTTSGAPTTIPCTAAGRTLIGAADAAAQRTALEVVKFVDASSAVGGVRPIATTLNAGNRSLQGLNANINAGTWLYFFLVQGGSNAITQTFAGVTAFNTLLVETSGSTVYSGFAIRVA